VRYAPEDGKWEIIQTQGLAEVRTAYADGAFRDAKNALKKFLCSYFSVGDCNVAQGKAICPIGATSGGGKILKVRWGVPGCGKSGGLRLCVVVYCDRRRVVIAEAFARSDDPPSQAFLDAVAELD
jgi:hypothetical protein